jgi:hypothetical protein
MEKWV